MDLQYGPSHLSQMDSTVSCVPKSFFDLQLHKPKNRSNINVLSQALLEGSKKYSTNQDIEEILLDRKTHEKEEELKMLTDQLKLSGLFGNKKDAKDNDDGEKLDESYGEISLVRKPGAIGTEFHLGNSQEEALEMKNAATAKQQTITKDFQYPDQMHRMIRENETNIRAQQNELSQGPQGFLNPNSTIGFARPAKNQPLASNFTTPMFYDPVNNDLNRRANREYNRLDHLEFLGSGHPGFDPALDRLRKLQQYRANRVMLEEQILEKQRQKQQDKLNRKLEDRKEEERIKRENEELAKKLAQETMNAKDKKDAIYRDNLEIAEKKRQEQERLKALKFAGRPLSQTGEAGVTDHEEIKSRILDEPPEMKVTTEGLIYQKDKVKEKLQEELLKDKKFMRHLPSVINDKIELIMQQQLGQMKADIIQGTNQMRDNLINLRSQAIELDEDRRRVGHEINLLRGHLKKSQFDEKQRTDELLTGMAQEELNRIVTTESNVGMPLGMIRNTPRQWMHISDQELQRMGLGEPTKIYSDEYFNDGYPLHIDRNDWF